MKNINIPAFQENLLTWYRDNKRDLPWREDQDPYKIWVSEIMLQQTRVDTVIPYFNRFISLFPTPEDLAEADEEDVLKVWEGLGYYSRVRNLQQAVKEVSASYDGIVPDTEKEIRSLKGVGPYTAGAILSIAYGKAVPAVDGNVMRVLSRIFTVYDDITKPLAKKIFDQLSRDMIPTDAAGDYNQAVMELGATVCTPKNPHCLTCPVEAHCHARKEGVQSLLPVKAKKKPPRTEYWQAVVIIDENGNVFLNRRPDTGLLAKMWEFPMYRAEENAGEDALLKKLGNRLELKNVKRIDQTQEVRHIFSHIVWEIDVYLVQLTGALNSTAEDEQVVSPDELNYYPFSVSHQKIIDGTVSDYLLSSI